MPYSVIFRPSGAHPGKPWAKIEQETGRIASRHSTKERAKASIRAYYASLISNATNPLRMDPTRTTAIRKAFMLEIRKTFSDLEKALQKFLVEDDALGLVEKKIPTSFADIIAHAQPRQYQFLSDDKKLDAFNEWFAQQTKASVLSPDPGTPIGTPWTTEYVESAYKRGQLNAYLSSKQAKLLDTAGVGGETTDQFLRSSFGAPEAMSKVRLLGTRSWQGLKGITDSIGTELNRILAEGMINGSGAVAIAKQMRQRVGFTQARAMTFARTEIINAHAEGQLDAFTKLGISELGVKAEWSTAGDDRVCEECFGMEGQLFSVEEARGLIPLHPNCRCSWIPAPDEKKGKTEGTSGFLPESEVQAADAVGATLPLAELDEALRTARTALGIAKQAGASADEIARLQRKVWSSQRALWKAKQVTPPPVPAPIPTPAPAPAPVPVPKPVIPEPVPVPLPKPVPPEPIPPRPIVPVPAPVPVPVPTPLPVAPVGPTLEEILAKARAAFAAAKKAGAGAEELAKLQREVWKAQRAAWKAKTGGVKPAPVPAPAPKPVPTPLPAPIAPTPIPAPVPAPVAKPVVAPAPLKYKTAKEYREALLKVSNPEDAVMPALAAKRKAAFAEYERLMKEYYTSGRTAAAGTAKDKAYLAYQSLMKEERVAAKAFKETVRKTQLASLFEANSLSSKVTFDRSRVTVRAESAIRDVLSLIPANRVNSYTIADISGIKTTYKKMEGNVLGSCPRFGRQINIHKKLAGDPAEGGVVAHEFGHYLSFKQIDIYNKQDAFFAKRTTGEAVEMLPGYACKGKKDDWGKSRMYAGRVYDDGSSPEVISVGVELLYENPNDFARVDPEYFDFIISVLKGL